MWGGWLFDGLLQRAKVDMYNTMKILDFLIYINVWSGLDPLV